MILQDSIPWIAGALGLAGGVAQLRTQYLSDMQKRSVIQMGNDIGNDVLEERHPGMVQSPRSTSAGYQTPMAPVVADVKTGRIEIGGRVITITGPMSPAEFGAIATTLAGRAEMTTSSAH